ncbi:MAG: TolC family protein [Syntrophobacteraceae bacterium]|nr:TolC family protein [Syntrophobacteraceae bacterium]
MKRFQFVILFFCLSAPLRVWAKTPPPATPMQPLTREAAVDFALAHNQAYRAAFEDVSASHEKVNQAIAGFLPKVDGSYNYTRWQDQPFVSIVGTSFQNIPFSVQNDNRWQVGLVQPLFTGFQLESNYKASKAGLQISKYNLHKACLDLTRDVKVAYLQTLLGEKLVQVARDNVASLEVQRKNAQANFDQGVAARNDVLKADVALAQAVQRERQTVKQLIILRSTLNQYLGINLEEKVALAGIEEKNCRLPHLDRLYEIARDKRPEYLSLKEAIKQAGYSRTAAEGDYYPHVSAFAQYYREGEDFSGANNPYTNSHNAAVGVSVNWNLFAGGRTRAAVLEWDYRLRGLQERRTDLLQKIDLQVKDALRQLQVAKANIATSKTALTQAEENERITSLQYKEQVAIFLDVLNSEVFLAQSRADFYQSVYGYEIAKAELERAIAAPLN